MRITPLLLLASCAAAPRAVPPADSVPTRLTEAQRARDQALLPQAAAILGAYSNTGAQLTRSGAVVFISTRDGLPQLYVGDEAHPDAPPRRLPSPPERVGGFALTPDEKTVLFRSDVGSDNQFHLFAVGLDGKGLVDLTPGEKLQRGWPVPARAKAGLFAWSAHATGDEKALVFLQSTDGSPPRQVHSDPRGGTLHDLLPDGSSLLFGRFNSTDDVVVFEIDAVSGASRRIYPPEGIAVSCGALYSSDGSRIYIGAHAEGRHAELLAIDRKSLKTLARYEETLLPEGSIEDVAVSPDGNRLAITVDGGDHFELRFLDARTLKLERTVAAPLATVTAGRFTADGARLTLGLSRPDAPGDIFAADAATGTLTPLRADARPGLSSFRQMKTSIESVRGFDGLFLPVNLYLPSGAGEKLPTIVRIHGGPSDSAHVRWNTEVRFFTSQGYAVVEPNIRGSTGFGIAFQRADDRGKRGDALKDVESINRWARAQPWCDPERMIIMGTSYGGYMTLLALTRQPSLWRAGVELSGMSDLRTMEKLEDQALRVYDETEFGKLGVDDAILSEWSPLKDADRIAAPLFVYQGVNDVITPQNEADQIVRALRQRGVPVEYLLLPNEGHGLVRRDNFAAFLARAARFLETHAGPLSRAAPQSAP